MTAVTFTNAEQTTPTVAFTYDADDGRLATMVDGTRTTTYAYHAVMDPPSLGSGQLASVDGPLTDDTITYSYDELGRVVTRAINGPANTVAGAFDALGRTTSEQNLLGTFTYTYDGTTGRVATVTYPNSQTSTYSYYHNQGDVAPRCSGARTPVCSSSSASSRPATVRNAHDFQTAAGATLKGAKPYA